MNPKAHLDLSLDGTKLQMSTGEWVSLVDYQEALEHEIVVAKPHKKAPTKQWEDFVAEVAAKKNKIEPSAPIPLKEGKLSSYPYQMTSSPWTSSSASTSPPHVVSWDAMVAQESISMQLKPWYPAQEQFQLQVPVDHPLALALQKNSQPGGVFPKVEMTLIVGGKAQHFAVSAAEHKYGSLYEGNQVQVTCHAIGKPFDPKTSDLPILGLHDD